MLQHSRNPQGDGQGMPGRGMNDGRERNRTEGFEGMNYEQIRQPYPQNAGNHRSDDHDAPANNTNSDD